MSKEVKVGVIIIIAVIGGIWGFNYLKGVNLFNRGELNLYAIYENVGGLSSSSPVIYEGFKIGRIKSIRLDSAENKKLRVDFVITNDDIKIPEDSKAKIISSDLLGSKAINIQMGTAPNTVEPGQKMTSEIQTDLTDAVRAELEPLKIKTEQLVEDVDRFLLVVKGILEDDATTNLPEAFEALSRSLQTLETSSKRVDGMIEENREKFGSVMSNVRDITETFKTNSGAIDTIIHNFSSISDSLSKVEFTEVLKKVSSAMAEIAEITEKINSGQGSLGQLVNSDSLVVELQQSNQELQYLLNDLYTHPKKYVGFSIIGRKDRNGFSKKEEEEIKEIITEQTDK